MKDLTQFLKDSQGQFSSTRLFMLLVAFSCIIDWQHAIWTKTKVFDSLTHELISSSAGVWHPEPNVLLFTASILGFKIGQNIVEKFKGLKIKQE